MSKVTITNIEHIDWARRLIITYYLSQDCFDPTIGGWEYIVGACAYKNICDDNWIILVPNTQHPLHDTVIKLHGEYQYVWDYGGIQGLDPADFDATHNYVIQLALYDTSCNMTDPCAFAGYTTPNGEEPQGTVDTLGDVGNTYNNCGDGYWLRADPNGCLYCEQTTTTTGDTGSDGTTSTEGGSSNGSIPTDTDPPVAGDGGAGGLFTPIDGGFSAPQGPIVIEAPDVPDGPNTTPGPLGPYSNGLDPLDPDAPGGNNGGGTFGQPGTSLLPGSYSAPSGPITNEEGTQGPGTTFNGTLVGSAFGGSSPSMFSQNNMNSRASIDSKDYLSQNNANANKRYTADQLNISPNQLNGLLNNDITSNVPVTDTSISNTTRINTAISTDGGTTNLRGKTMLFTKVNIQNENRPINALEVPGITNIPTRNKNDASANRYTTKGAQDRDLNTSTVQSKGATVRSYSAGLISQVANVTYYKNTQNFDSNFTLSLFAEPTVRAGDGIFCETKLSPRFGNPYRYTLSVFLKNSSGVKLLATSHDIVRKGFILISKKLRITGAPGDATIVSVVSDIDGSIQGVKSQNITILDAGTQQGGIPLTPLMSSLQTKPLTATSSIDALISANQSFVVPLGAPHYYHDLVVNATSSSLSLALLGVLVRSDNPNIEYVVEVKINNITVQRAVGKPDVNGIKPTGNYSTALYQFVNRSQYSSAVIRVSSVSAEPSTATVELGPDFTFQGYTIVPSIKLYTPGTRTLVMTFTGLPFSSTSLSFFDAGGENMIPSNPAITNVTTSANGSVTVSVPCAAKSWVGVAWAEPAELPLSKRIIGYIREDVSR